MRLSSSLFKSLILLGAVFNSTAAIIPSEDLDDFQLRQLTDENFKSSTSQGIWLVEHFSPKCGHCKAFSPTWTQLAKDYNHLERLMGFHMAQVNCLAQGDLCNSNSIKFYPQIILYTDGVPSPYYSGDRSYGDLAKYIEEHSTAYAENLLGPINQQDLLNSSNPNPDGRVLEADEQALEKLKADGPVLAEYYAPWCGHCKQLRPTYEQLAQNLKGKLTVAAINCEEHKSFCTDSGVNGYPTIRLLHHGTRSEFTGPRTLTKLIEFAQKGQQSLVIERVKADDFDKILNSNEAFFLYLQTYHTTVAEVSSVKKALGPLLGSVPTFTSADPILYKRLHISHSLPSSTLLAFSSHSIKHVGSLLLPAQDSTVQRFVALHRYPTVSQLNSSNFQSLMRSDDRAVIVLGAVHEGEEGKKEVSYFEKVARAWKRGGRKFQQPVWFVWVEGDEWAKWLKQFYGINSTDLPAAVVIDTPNDEFYDTTIEGAKIEFDGASIFSVLEGFYQHFLRPKPIESTLVWGSRNAAGVLISFGELSTEHPYLAFSILVGGVVIFVYLLQKCNGKDPKESNMSLSGFRLD
ncbi:protein disulfide-isomerase domain [Cryptococcus depauperatus]